MSSRTRLLLVALVIVIAIGGFFLWRHLSMYESTDDAEVDAHIHPISARVSGYVIDIPVKDNQYVTKGTVLVRIDPRDYQVAVDQAQAELAAAKATAEAAGINVPITSISTSSSLSEADAGVLNARAGITVAQEQARAAADNLKQAQANDIKAQNDLQRYAQLVAKQEISQQEYDQAVAAASGSTAAVAGARASAAAASQEVAQAQSKLAQADAGRKSALTGPRQVASLRSQAQSALADAQQKQAKLEQAELNLQYTTIVASVDGVVYRTVEVGENVQPGQQLISIVPVDEVYVTADFKETQLKHIRVGQRAVVHVDAFGRDYTGHVESVAGASGASFSLLPPENATGNYVKVVQRLPVKIVLDPGQNDDRLLRVGMSVEPKVYIK
jgi:membrane fusion protein, multidrug efflux system